MDNLTKNWFVEGWIDFEYKKYLLLAYLKKIKNSFDKVELYPHLSNIIEHYDDLIRYNEQQANLKSSFQKELNKVDINKLKLHFNSAHQDDMVEKIMEIVDFAIPKLKTSLERGAELYDFIQSKIKMDSVGIIPFYKKEGYLILLVKGDKKANVYRYKSSLIHQNNNRFHGLVTTKIDEFKLSISTSLASIKVDLVKKYSDLPTPATYVVHCSMKFPEIPSIMPIAKRLLLKEVAQAA